MYVQRLAVVRRTGFSWDTCACYKLRICAQFHFCNPSGTASLLPRSTGYRPGDPRPTSTTGIVQTKTSTPQLELLGPTVLDYSAPPVVWVGRVPHHCEA